MKKLFLVLTALALLTSCSSAGRKADPESSAPVAEVTGGEEKVSADEIKADLMERTDCYRAEEITLPEGMVHFDRVYPLDNGSLMVIGTNSTYTGSIIVKTDRNFSHFEEYTYEKPEEMESSDRADDALFFNADGSAVSFVTLEDHGGLVLPEEFDENFDYDSYDNNITSSFMICTYNENGEITGKSFIDYPEGLIDENYGYLRSGLAIPDGDSLIQPFEDSSIRRVKADGTVETLYTDPKSSDDFSGYSPHLVRDRDGKIFCVSHVRKDVVDSNGNQAIESVVNVSEFDGSSLSDDVVFSCSESELSGMPVSGYGEYRLFVPTHSGLVGLRDDDSTETVIDWAASSLDDSINAFPMEDNNFIGVSYGGQNGRNIVKLVPRDMGELAGTKIITLTNYWIDMATINAFNNSQTDYRVEIVEYPEGGNDSLNMDIIQGKAPDIICGLDYATYLNYRNKGVFVDLRSMMDEELNEEMILPNVLGMLGNEEGLFALCPSFSVKTIATKTSVSDKENWTFDDMVELYDNAPPTATHIYDGQSKEEMFEILFSSMSGLINYDTAECDFNNERFIKMLEFCNRFVDTVEMPSKFDDPVAHQNYYTEKFHWFGNGQTLIEYLNFHTVTEYNLLKYVQNDGTDITLAGYPSDDGKGGLISPLYLISINQTSKEKEGAWEFVKFCMKQGNRVKKDDIFFYYGDSIPAFKQSLKDLLELEMKRTHSASGNEYPSYTEEESEMIYNYILSCEGIGTVADKDVKEICKEEAGIYFAGGQTAEQAAEHIQNRVSIIISEKL